MFQLADLAVRGGSAEVPVLHAVDGLHAFATEMEENNVDPSLQTEFLQHAVDVTRRQTDLYSIVQQSVEAARAAIAMMQSLPHLQGLAAASYQRVVTELTIRGADIIASLDEVFPQAVTNSIDMAPQLEAAYQSAYDLLKTVRRHIRQSPPPSRLAPRLPAIPHCRRRRRRQGQAAHR